MLRSTHVQFGQLSPLITPNVKAFSLPGERVVIPIRHVSSDYYVRVVVRAAGSMTVPGEQQIGTLPALDGLRTQTAIAVSSIER